MLAHARELAEPPQLAELSKTPQNVQLYGKKEQQNGAQIQIVTSGT